MSASSRDAITTTGSAPASAGSVVSAYEMIGAPLVSAGADQRTCSASSPRTTSWIDGGAGGPAGTTSAQTADASLMPARFTACTLKPTAWPLRSPPTTHEQWPVSSGGDASTVSGSAPRVVGVTTYASTSAPLSNTGGRHCTRAEASPGVADTSDGAPGGPAGTTGADGADSSPVPARDVADTAKVVGTPLRSPVAFTDVRSGFTLMKAPVGATRTV
mmetsp:Transcript_8471/g.30117  ORF Transcript_8471/g.30117 Transcript_8471/m.30117 type:complete len:217 (+) Transcript_8471:1696-2346(+)